MNSWWYNIVHACMQIAIAQNRGANTEKAIQLININRYIQNVFCPTIII